MGQLLGQAPAGLHSAVLCSTDAAVAGSSIGAGRPVVLRPSAPRSCGWAPCYRPLQHRLEEAVFAARAKMPADRTATRLNKLTRALKPDLCFPEATTTRAHWSPGRPPQRLTAARGGPEKVHSSATAPAKPNELSLHLTSQHTLQRVHHNAQTMQLHRRSRRRSDANRKL